MGKPELSSGTPFSPSFFKVMIGDFSQNLRIPPAFVKQFDGVLPQKFLLRSLAGKLRRVNVKKFENNYFFDKGWRLFVQDNSIEFGDLLVFWYSGNSEFNVIIYGKNGCKKEVAVKSSEVIYIDSDSTSDETGMSSPQDQCESKEFQPRQGNFKQSTTKERACSKLRQVIKNSPCSRVPMAMQGKARALEVANKFFSEHPFFKIVMAQSYIRKGGLVLPTRFFKRYIKLAPQCVTLRVSDRTWPVKLINHCNYSGRLSEGASLFLRDNKLGEGDVCVFELIKRNDIVLKVSIFRCIG